MRSTQDLLQVSSAISTPSNANGTNSSQGEYRPVSGKPANEPLKTKCRRFLICKLVAVMCHCCKVNNTYTVAPVSLDISDSDLLPPSEEAEKKTLVLDLDETLIHTTLSLTKSTSFTTAAMIQHQIRAIFVSIRPGLSAFLKEASKDFELVVFTASEKHYANPVLDIIDPEHLITHRLFRDQCTYQGNICIKDLSRLGRDLRKVVLVDVRLTQNSPFSYVMQPNNGLSIATYLGDPKDTALLNLLPTLSALKSAEDVRELLSQHSPAQRSLHSSNIAFL